jgi:transposase
MPWRESSVMEERLCFVARLLDGEAMTAVCREFGISRKTGYKILSAAVSTGWTLTSMVPQEGFEPPTPSLRMMCSTG